MGADADVSRLQQLPWYVYVSYTCCPLGRIVCTHPGYYSGGQDYYTHYEGAGFDLHVDKGPRCGSNCSVVDWSNHGVYSTLLYGAAAVDLILSHNASVPLYLYLAFQAGLVQILRQVDIYNTLNPLLLSFLGRSFT